MSYETRIVTRKEVETTMEYTYLSSLIITELHLQIMERLQGTRHQNQYMRNGCKLVVQELKSKLSKEVDIITGIDDRIIFSIQEGVEAVMREVAMVRPEYIAVIAEIIKKFREQPQDMIEALNINVYDETPESEKIR